VSLVHHPDAPGKAVAGIDVEVRRQASAMLQLRYILRGGITALRMPQPAAPMRADRLWQHTCFEAFLAPQAGDAYCEFNFSPSTQWAAYRFDAYREGMQDVDLLVAPKIDVTRTEDSLVLDARIDLRPVPELHGDLCVALTAVIEEADDTLSYWALAHAEGKPDFHRKAGFTLLLSAGRGDSYRPGETRRTS
jgi:hypothetical protein